MMTQQSGNIGGDIDGDALRATTTMKCEDDSRGKQMWSCDS
jgi:hypothetical protein